jgi:hypothetical protein
VSERSRNSRRRSSCVVILWARLDRPAARAPPATAAKIASREVQIGGAASRHAHVMAARHAHVTACAL